MKGYSMNMKTIPIFLAFLIMGIADAMGPMGDAVKNQYELTNVMAHYVGVLCVYCLCFV